MSPVITRMTWEVADNSDSLPKRHLPHHLYERLVFLLIGNGLFSLSLGLWDVYSGKWNQPQWARDGVSSQDRDRAVRLRSSSSWVRKQETRGMRFEREVKKILASVPSAAVAFTVIFTFSWLSFRTQLARWTIQLSGGLLRYVMVILWIFNIISLIRCIQSLLQAVHHPIR